MKALKTLFFAVSAMLAVDCYSQAKCEQIDAEAAKWDRLNQINSGKENMSGKEKRDLEIKYAHVLKDSLSYRFNDAGELEGEYIILLDQSHKIEDLKDATMDYFSKKFTLTSHYKKDIDKRSELKETGTNSLYLHTVYPSASVLTSGLATHVIDIDVVFIVKFKEDRIKITTSIPSYQYNSGIKSDIRSIKNYPPYTSYGDSQKDKRDDAFFCRGYAKACECLFQYTKAYCEYLNKNLTDW